MDDIKRPQSLNKPFSPNQKVKPEEKEERADSSLKRKQSEKPMFNDKLMEDICDRSNIEAALKRVQRNKGSPGVDGKTVQDLRDFLGEHWAELKEQLLSGVYQPKGIRRVEIPKPKGGGKRRLGIPTVLDRLIQQATLQVLQPSWDKTFSESSFGFRPNRSAHHAITRAQEYVQEGYGIVVDIDLENFFDRVNHDRLMSRLQQEITDKRVLKLIQRYLKAGCMDHGIGSIAEGTPQGGPLSPFLSNIVLDELDKELEARGHKFSRYADDCKTYVKSIRAGERVMESMKRFITRRLRLKVNLEKSKVGMPNKRSFLGFRLMKGSHRRRISPEAIEAFKRKVRLLTRRRDSLSMKDRVAKLSQYLRGWRGYYGYCQTPSVLRDLDSWIRRRLRSIYWKQWKVYKCRKRELIGRGVHPVTAHLAAWSAKGPWRMSHAVGTQMALPNDYFTSIGLSPLLV